MLRSNKTNLSDSGELRIINEVMIDSSSMDIPLPFAPLIKICGAFDKSIHTASPLTFWPNGIANGCFLTSGNASYNSLKLTVLQVWFSTSNAGEYEPIDAESYLTGIPPNLI